MTNKAADDIEAETGSLPHGLGGEEGIEDARENLRRNAGAVVDDAHDDALTVAACIDLNAAAILNRIERVVDEVSPNLIELACESAHQRQAGFQLDGNLSGFLTRLGSHHGHGVAEVGAKIHRLGDHGLIHVRESLDGHDEAGDAHGRILNFRGQAAHGASRRGPANDRVESRALDGGGKLIERIECDRRIGKDVGVGRDEPMIRQPVGNGLFALGLLKRRADALRRASQAGIANSVDGGELRIAEPGRAERESRGFGFFEPVLRDAALRSMADAGLLSSWARPAESLPSEIIFSFCKSLEVNRRARSSMMWTRMAVIV